MSSRYLLDSWALLALVHEEQPAADHIEHLLRQVANGRASLYMSVINLGEIFYIITRRRGVPAGEELIGDIKRLPIHVLQADEKRVMAAARVKAAHPISYADAFAVAATMELDATLVTGDPELLVLEGLNLKALQRGTT